MKIQDEAADYHCWTRLPNIVLEKIENPYELTLLFAIRKVAGDDLENGNPPGICFKRRDELAKEAKMSPGMVTKTIKGLAEKGLILAEKKVPPNGGRWPGWHLTVPRSLWEENETVYRQRKKERREKRSHGNQVEESGHVVTDFAESVTECPKSGHRVSMTKNPLTKNQGLKEPTPPKSPPGANGRGGDPDVLIQASERILLEEGVLPGTAHKLATEHGFGEIATAARTFRPGEAKGDPAALLVWRIRNREFSVHAPDGRDPFAYGSLLYHLQYCATLWDDVERGDGISEEAHEEVARCLEVIEKEKEDL